MHGKGERTEAAHARAARASEGHGRALLPCAFLLALVALLLVPTRAYADGGGGSHYFGGDGSANYRTVLYSSNYADGVQYIVGADNKYDAAAYICGQTSAQVAAYDLTVRYKLSATENDFAALADSLERVWPGWNEETLGQNLASVFARAVNGTTLWDVMTNILTGSLSHFQIYYWQNNVDCDIYAIDTTSNAVTLARDDLQEILNGGGGSGGGVQGDEYITTFRPSKYSQSQTYDGVSYYSTGSAAASDTRVYMADTGTLIIRGTAINLFKRLENDGFKILVEYSPGSSFNVYAYEGDVTYTYQDANVGGTTKQRVNTVVNTYDAGDKYVSRINLRYTLDSINANTIIVTSNQNPSYSASTRSSSGTQTVSSTGTALVWGLSSDTTGTQPPDNDPGNWPDPPSNPDPEPPTVPDPPQNPEPDPPSTPTAPTPPPLEPPTNVTIPTGTTAADYTPWLRAILEQLQTLTDEVASHCVHLQEEMQQSVNDLTDALIYRFNSLESQIWDLFNGLEDYLHDLAEWLAEQLDFNVNADPYDDSSVLYWLRQIYSRLGNLPKSPTTVMDPDPTEPFDFWAWLMNLIANTVGGIIGDLVGDVAGLLDLFKDKFPFSIPWDIAALLTLLDGTRATPAFDVKIAAVQGWWQETTFRIDLTPFDSVASACRTMVNILWIMVLVMKTDWMLAIMGDATSFGERFARKVARTS